MATTNQIITVATPAPTINEQVLCPEKGLLVN